MSSVLGIIPAAGKAERWGGHYKELLPTRPGECLLSRTAHIMFRARADAVLVVTRPEKMAVHAAHLSDSNIPVYYAVQSGDNDIWSAIEESFAFPADEYLFAMPDTYIPPNAFEGYTGQVFGMGLFETNTPERFGVLHGGRIVNKTPLGMGRYDAWGVLSWPARVARYWQDSPPVNYTDAINLAIGRFVTQTWRLDYYHDMATYDDYRTWMRQGARAKEAA